MTKTTTALDDLMPQNPVMAGAWVSSFQYALGRADILAAFREDTGKHFQPASNPIDRLIDDATGAELEFIRAFAKWHNEHIWGEEDGKPVDAV